METRQIVKKHPCYSNEAHHRFGRIHIPVAFACNIRCNYCEHKQCVNEHRPAVSQRVMKVDEVLDYVEAVIDEQENITVVAVAGQGDSLVNPETFKALKIVHDRYPDLIKCIATNGYYLPEKITVLKDCGVKTITVTVNALKPEIGALVYEHVMGKRGVQGAKDLIERQKKGVKKAVEAGFFVKINTVFIPGVNESEFEEIAKYYSDLGAYIMNISPLIPLYNFKDKEPPTYDDLNEVRDRCEKYIKQFRVCQQCRADDAGLISKSKSVFDFIDKDIE
jgi:nitrogen fixation protein NifB